jgi:hypothetical protein
MEPRGIHPKKRECPQAFLLLIMTIVGHDNSKSCCVAAMVLSKT